MHMAECPIIKTGIDEISAFIFRYEQGALANLSCAITAQTPGEAVIAGTVKLVGTDQLKILSEAEGLLHNQEAYNGMAKSHNPYGDGTACDQIVDVLLNN